MTRTIMQKNCELVAGFDLSLTASGIVLLDMNGNIIIRRVIKVKSRGSERLHDIQNEIRAIIEKRSIKLVCIENYSFGSRNNREIMGELGGVIRLLLYRKNIDFLTPTPGQVKKFATGSGNGDETTKEKVMMNVFKIWGFEAKDNNEADAYTLARIALAIVQKNEIVDYKLLKHQKEVVNVVLNPPEKKKRKKKEDD